MAGAGRGRTWVSPAHTWTGFIGIILGPARGLCFLRRVHAGVKEASGACPELFSRAGLGVICRRPTSESRKTRGKERKQTLCLWATKAGRGTFVRREPGKEAWYMLRLAKETRWTPLRGQIESSRTKEQWPCCGGQAWIKAGSWGGDGKERALESDRLGSQSQPHRVLAG